MSYTKKVTPEQIEAICGLLHTYLQFYDAHGEPSNAATLDEIEKVLTAHSFEEVGRP